MVMDGALTWGGEHAVHCTGDVLWNCAPEASLILLTSITLKNSIKRGQKEKCKSLRYIVG